MSRAAYLFRAVTLPVRIDGGETVTMATRLVFSHDGALMRVIVPDLPTHDPRARAARRLLQRIDVELARPGAPGVAQIQREAELQAALAEQLLDLEAQHGPALARTARLAADT